MITKIQFYLWMSWFETAARLESSSKHVILIHVGKGENYYAVFTSGEDYVVVFTSPAPAQSNFNGFRVSTFKIAKIKIMGKEGLDFSVFYFSLFSRNFLGFISLLVGERVVELVNSNYWTENSTTITCDIARFIAQPNQTFLREHSRDQRAVIRTLIIR